MTARGTYLPLLLAGLALLLQLPGCRESAAEIVARRQRGAVQRMRRELCAEGLLAGADCEQLAALEQLRELER